MKTAEEVKINKKNCMSCDEVISDKAIICYHCGANQGKKRYLHLSNTVMALIVALLSVASFAIPKIQMALVPKQSSVIMNFAFSDRDNCYFNLENKGKNPALLKKVRLKFLDYQIAFDWKNLSKLDSGNWNSHIVEQSNTHIYGFSRKEVIHNELEFSWATGEEEESYHEYQKNWQEYFRGFDEKEVDDYEWFKILMIQYNDVIQNFLESEMENISLDWDVQNNRSRIEQFKSYYENDSIPEEFEETIEYFDEATKLGEILENYISSNGFVFEADIVNSDGSKETLENNVPYEALREFIFPFIMGNASFDKEAIEYFFKKDLK